MADEKLLTVREVSIMLDISEKEVLDLAESGKIPAYKVGGVYLRFRRDQVLEFRRSRKPLSVETGTSQYSFRDKLRDFFYFNDFYIVVGVLIILLLIVISQGY